ncbi:hypothetical protein DFH08DRAFT_809238 [Mycena albidolilacea]|uniref:F-box domain-containing protein n=1 Tax=Mycena albidolilacea TaxID=1033008 RepID=A0AAD7ERI8_9AGAR|nr:hypothetical protein DFH08DRAFT_809238 [Mycena albidolilacea]
MLNSSNSESSDGFGTPREKEFMASAPPIAMIPPELLCNIFTLGMLPVKFSEMAVIPATDRSIFQDPWILGGPWVLGQVCSLWRAVALSLPTIWTSITVFTTIMPHEFSLLNTQLARTAQHPLDVHIRFTNRFGSWEPYSDEFNLFLVTLMSHSRRWRTFHLQFDTKQRPHEEFNALGPGTLPILQELVFSGPGVYHVNKYDFFKDAPALRRVVLGTRGMSLVGNIALPWAQLTTYKATYLDAASHFRYLAVAVNLVDCDLDCDGSPHDDIRLHSAVILPRLRRLAVSHPVLLAALSAPALQSLYIVGPVENVADFLGRSGCTSALTELTLAECTAPASEIIALLQETCGLTTLALYPRSSPTALVAAFTAPECLCPNLGSLSWADFDDALDWGAFAKMVLSRCTESSSVRPLHFVAIYSGRRLMKKAVWCLHELPGLEVVTMNMKKGSVPPLSRTPARWTRTQPFGSFRVKVPTVQHRPVHRVSLAPLPF